MTFRPGIGRKWRSWPFPPRSRVPGHSLRSADPRAGYGHLALARTVDLAGAKSDRYGHRLDGNTGEQFIQEALPAFAAFGCFGASNAVCEFEHGHNRNGDGVVAGFQRYGFEQLAGILALAFGGDGGRRVKYQSQAGGSSGSRWAAIAASTSFAKSGSIVAVESAGIRAMHSEILRRTGSAGRITATGCASRSMMTSRSGLDPLQDRPYILGQFAFADVQRLHTWDHSVYLASLSLPTSGTFASREIRTLAASVFPRLSRSV